MAAGKKRQKAGGDGGGLGGDEPAAKKAAAPAAEDTAPADAAPRQQAEAPAAKPESAFRAPDAAEVMEIARTRNLYKSNLFRLQLEELLKELAPRRAARARLEAFLHGLRPVLLGLEARELPADLAAEFPQLLFQQRQPFPMTFAAPKRIDVVGSFLLGTCLRSSLQADVALEMPAETFQSKDYLNFRYWDKRAAYVGEVRRQLAKAQGRGAPLAGVELLFEALHGDPCRPCLTLRPLDQDATAPWAVRLLPSCAADLFPPPKLAPNRNSVRPAEGAAAAAPAPTAQYNSCILEDVRMRACLEYLHRALQRFPSLRDAVLLLKRWAWARGFLAQQPGAQRAGGGLAVFTPLSGFCLSVLAAHAAQTASVAPTETSSFQLFKLALSVLASIDWESQKLVLGAAAPRALTAEERSTRGANFFDADGILNFFWRLGPFIGELKREAQRALTLLDTEADPYDAVFGRRMAPELLWDCVVRAPLLGSAAATPALAAPPPPHTVLGTPPPADACEALSLAARLPEVLAAGLGDRCLQVSARLVGEPGPRWDRERPAGALAVVAGITLDALHLDRSLDRGPSAEDVEAAARFRSLWGPEKSELRRFKDGSILECAVWTKPPADRAADSKKHPAVVTQILQHLLDRHFGEIASRAEILAGPVGFVPNLGERGRRLWAALEAFRTHACQLSSLPMVIKDVYPVGDAFSYTDIATEEAPVADDGITRQLHGAVVEFEASGRWPRDAVACRKVAAALLVQAREELLSDLGIEAEVGEDFLDVRYPEVAFRVRVFHPHELGDVAQRVTSFQAPAGGSASPSAADLARLRDLWWRPRIRNALHSHALRQPALAGAARLCKRWMASQMLSGYDEFVEHLVAHVFLHPAPFDSPTSPQAGFCRFCSLLDAHDWQHEPLMLDFDGRFSEEERMSLRRSFERSRSESERTTYFWVSSRFDPHAMLLPTPPATVCAWLQQRARHALGFFGRKLIGEAPAGSKGWQPMFALDTGVFDVVLRLRPRGRPEGGDSRRGGLARRRARTEGQALRSLVEKVRANLSPVCLVFYDAEGRMVAVKWRPGAFFPQHQNVLMGAVPHTMVSQKDRPVLCVPNVLYLTSVIASLAEGLAVDLTLVTTQSRTP